MSQDAILKVLITKGVDVVTVAHAGYTIPAHLRSALDVRDRKCIVPGCWEWIPPENRDVDLSALKRVITCARRC